MASRDINVIALVKGGERYVFLYDDDSREETLRTLAKYASNPELSFSWYDAAMLGQKVRGSTSQSRRHRFVPRADRPACVCPPEPFRWQRTRRQWEMASRPR